jgi:hypothetical protein
VLPAPSPLNPAPNWGRVHLEEEEELPIQNLSAGQQKSNSSHGKIISRCNTYLRMYLQSKEPLAPFEGNSPHTASLPSAQPLPADVQTLAGHQHALGQCACNGPTTAVRMIKQHASPARLPRPYPHWFTNPRCAPYNPRKLGSFMHGP